jgi:hypothetical protein
MIKNYKKLACGTSALFTVVPVLILFTVVAYHLTATAVGEATATFFHHLVDTCLVATAAAEGGTVVGMHALTAAGHRTECGRCFQVVKVLVGSVLKSKSEYKWDNYF